MNWLTKGSTVRDSPECAAAVTGPRLMSRRHGGNRFMVPFTTIAKGSAVRNSPECAAAVTGPRLWHVPFGGERLRCRAPPDAQHHGQSRRPGESPVVSFGTREAMV